MNTEELATILEDFKQNFQAHEIKLYFKNKNNYCVKFIKNNEIVARIKKGTTRKGVY